MKRRLRSGCEGANRDVSFCFSIPEPESANGGQQDDVLEHILHPAFPVYRCALPQPPNRVSPFLNGLPGAPSAGGGLGGIEYDTTVHISIPPGRQAENRDTRRKAGPESRR